MIGKAKQLEEQLREKISENESLCSQVAEMKACIEEYKEKENAISLALTEAQASATRLLREAKERSDVILSEADATLAAARQEAAHIKEAAEKEAEEILTAERKAAEHSRAMITEQENECRNAAEGFLKDLEAAARDAAQAAANFRIYCLNQTPKAKEAIERSKEISSSLDTDSAPLVSEQASCTHTAAENASSHEDDSKREKEELWPIDEVAAAAECDQTDTSAAEVRKQLDALLDEVLAR